MSDVIDDRVRAVFARTLRIDPAKLSEETRRGEFVEWDSLGHLLVVKALEDEFGISIAPEQALDLETVADVKRMLMAARIQ